MLYPLITYNDGTEVTSSKFNEQGRLTIYIEKYSVEKDKFISLEIELPGCSIKSCNGYSDEEAEKYKELISKISSDIIEYVKEREGKSALYS